MKKLRLCICFAVIALLFSVSAGLGFLSAAAALETPAEAFVGGFPIGISVNAGGLLVEDVTGVETEFGTANVEGLRKGDVITKIDGIPVDGADVDNIFGELGDTVKLEILRDGDLIEIETHPLVEQYSKKRKLGVRVKDKIYGIGTVTYITSDGKFAALGHEIFDSDTDTHLPFCGGSIHECKILGIKRGNNNEAGAILASLLSDGVIGDISCNNGFGIAGNFSGDGKQKGEYMPIASRSEIKLGKASIRTTVESEPEYYDIEIIKASGKSGRNEKSLVFRVTDKRLLEKTGGIVRGMSGSPIVQNGKIVGCVTHVFLSDFTKGYGLYADSLNVA